MFQLTRRQKDQAAKRLAIASAIIVLLMFVVKEMLVDNLKESHDSLAAAVQQYQNELSQSGTSLQFLTTQQQLERRELDITEASRDPHHDYSSMIIQDTTQAQEAKTNLDAGIDSVSRLIDKMPSGARDLRQLRDQARIQIEKYDKQITETLKPQPDRTVGRLVEVKIAAVMALVQELPVIALGDAASTAAKRALHTDEQLIHLCQAFFYFLALSSLGLGIYAAIMKI